MKTFFKTITTLMLGMALGSATLAAAAPATVKAVIADFKIVVNGETKALSKAPIVVDGTTYLPVREVANLVGADLNYDGANKKIELSTKGVTSMPTTQAEWISLKDLVEKYGFSVGQSSSSNGLFEVKSNDELLFSIDAAKVTTDDYSVTTSTGKVVHIKSDAGTTFVNVDDLVSAGIIQ